MFVWSFRMNKRELIITAAGLALFIALALVLLFRGGAFEKKAPENDCRAATAEQRERFITSYGWEIERSPLAVREVTIPERFDEELSAYSELQSAQGFDFEALRGKRVKLWTYRVTNYPAEDKGIAANLLVRNGKVVGGDISQTVDGGMIQGFDPAAYSAAAAAFQDQIRNTAIDRSVPDSIPADSDALPEPDSEGEW